LSSNKKPKRTKKKKTTPEVYIKEESMSDLWNVWYSELHQGKSGLTLKIRKLIESTESKFQRIDVVDTYDFGKALVLYGSLMVAERDLNAYNEMITHVPLFSHPKPSSVLIIGGGDGGAMTNIMKHPEVKKAVQCEIDRKVVEISKKHFPNLTKGFNDKRCSVVFKDGKKYIEHGKEKFDIIILDLSDPIGPAADLFQKSFHQKVFERLKNDGIMVAQTESPFYNEATVGHMFKNLKDIFPIAKMYTSYVPIYPSCYWSFAFCSKKYHPIDDFNAERYKKLYRKMKNEYYNAEVHIGSFLLPQFAKKIIGE